MKVLVKSLNNKFKELKITNYYLNKAQNKKRSVVSRSFDHFASFLFITLVTFLAIYMINQRFFFSIAGGAAVSLCVISAIYFSQKAKSKVLRLQNRMVICEKLIDQYIDGRENEEFYKDIIEIIKTNGDFTKVTLVADNLIKCKYKDNNTMIIIKKAVEKALVNLEEVKELRDKMKQYQCHKGIFIVSSEFTNAALAECSQGEGNISDVGRQKLYRLLKDSQHYPSDKQIDEIEETEIFNRSKKTKQDVVNMVINGSKTKKYLILAVFLFVFSGFMDNNSYYRIAGAILSILAILSFSINYWKLNANSFAQGKIDIFD